MVQGSRLKALVRDVSFARLDADVQKLVGGKLLLVEHTVAEKLKSPYVPLAEMGAYLAESRGKRLRPTLLLLVSKTLGYEGDADVVYAAVYEFIHTATLIHDDIVDEALLRRGRPSLNSRWGPERAVLMGDYVFITAMHVAVTLGWSGVQTVVADAALGLIRGELIQSHRKWDLTITPKENLEIIHFKTAGLFAACARTPAFLVDAPREIHEALWDYGRFMGIAFQLVDDCLDFRSDEGTLGKPAGLDLKEGKVTLPLILMMENGTPRDRAFVEALVASRRFDPEILRELVDRVIESGMVDEAEAVARDYAAKAAKLCEMLPKGPARDVLARLPEFVIRRRF
jgi:octaprenyl-diphosphate synthase